MNNGDFLTSDTPYQFIGQTGNTLGGIAGDNLFSDTRFAFVFGMLVTDLQVLGVFAHDQHIDSGARRRDRQMLGGAKVSKGLQSTP